MSEMSEMNEASKTSGVVDVGPLTQEEWVVVRGPATFRRANVLVEEGAALSGFAAEVVAALAGWACELVVWRSGVVDVRVGSDRDHWFTLARPQPGDESVVFACADGPSTTLPNLREAVQLAADRIRRSALRKAADDISRVGFAEEARALRGGTLIGANRREVVAVVGDAGGMRS